MARSLVTVFGGTGFLGRSVVRRLLEQGFSVRAASRHPERGQANRSPRPDLETIAADVNDGRSVAAAVAGAFGVVNAVSLYVERGEQTFRSVHVEAAARVATQAREAGVERLVLISGIGADTRSTSPYIRSRGEGERAVRAAFPTAILVRPAVMFGPDDAFLTPLLRLLRRLPLFALFGRGRTKLQPAYVEDVAEAVARALRAADGRVSYELGGPRVYSYRALIETLARQLGKRTLLLPLPFALWHLLAAIAELLPRPPITHNQVELMRIDNTAAPEAAGFDSLGISPRAIEEVLPLIRQQSGQ